MATIKEVAERAHVSTATVSYVLNDSGSVSEGTRQRVLAAVAALNYQPKYAARSLRGRSRTLGLVLPALAARLSDPALTEVLAGLSEAAAARGYYLLLATTSDELPEHALAEQLARSGRVDGIVLLDLQVDDERARFLHTRGVVFVCAGSPPVGVDCSSVALDLCGGAHAAVKHLLAGNHRRIGLIMLPSELAGSDPIYQGYVAALAAAAIAAAPELAIEAGTRQDDGVAAMQELLALPEPPTAVLAASDALAVGAMHAARDAGLAVGCDVALVGFDDLPLAAHTHPPLSAVRAPRAELGRQLARLLIETIEQPARPAQALTLEMPLIIRKSSAISRRERVAASETI